MKKIPSQILENLLLTIWFDCTSSENDDTAKEEDQNKEKGRRKQKERRGRMIRSKEKEEI